MITAKVEPASQVPERMCSQEAARCAGTATISATSGHRNASSPMALRQSLLAAVRPIRLIQTVGAHVLLVDYSYDGGTFCA